MDAGKLDQRIEIQTSITGRDSLNAQTAQWIKFAEVWASVRQTMGREFLKAEDVQAEGKASFTIRFREGVTSAMRVIWRGRTFGIEDVTGTRREGYLWLHCRSVQAENVTAGAD